MNTRQYASKHIGATLLLILLVCNPLEAYASQETERYEFYRAVIDGPVDKVKTMLDRGFDPNVTRLGSPVTYLMTAASQGNVEIARLLLEHGASPAVELSDGWTAVAFAAQNGRLEMVNLLLHLEPPPTQEHLDTAIMATARFGHPLTSKALVRAGADVNAPGSGGTTPLHQAARQGFPKTAKMLIDLGANIDQPDSKSRTPLMLSAWMAHEEVVELLLSNGADPEHEDNQGHKVFYGMKQGEHWKDLLQRHWYNAPVRPESCYLSIGYASIFKPEQSDSWRVSGYKLDKKPEEGTQGWVVGRHLNAAVRLKIENVQPNEYTRTELGKDAWNVEFESYDGAAFDSVQTQGAGLAIWPSPDSISIVENPQRGDLPWGMETGIVQIAIDLDNDDRPDLLDLEFCCSNHLTSGPCDYHCSNYWLKAEGRWVKCVSSTPA